VPFKFRENSIIRQLILSTVLLLNWEGALSQILQMDNYDIRNGLPSNVINDILQDRHGYMWFATQVGASRFDGYHFTNYGINNGLPGNETECLFEDSKGRIWVGTLGGGVAVLSGKNWSFIDKQKGLVNNHIKSVFEDPRGIIWCVSENGVSGITGDTIVTFSADNGLSGTIVTSSCIDNYGRLLLGTENGINRLTRDDRKNNWSIEHFLGGVIVLDLVHDKQDNLWIATQGNGIFQYNGNTFIRYTGRQGLPGNTVTRLLCDAEGSIWAGFYENGLGRFMNGSFIPLKDTRLRKTTVRKLAEDKKHRIWAVSQNNDGVFVISAGHVQHISVLNGLPDNRIWAFHEDSDGNIWMGSMSGISKIGKKPFELYTTVEGLPGKDVLSVFADSSGAVWGGTYNGPFVVMPDNTVHTFTGIRGLPADAPTVFKIAQDKNNMLWFATYYGPTLFTGERFRNFYNKDWEREGVNTSSITDIAVDEKNRLILAGDEGICIFYSGTYRYPDEYKELAEKDIRAISYDASGNLWICTSEGIFIYGKNRIVITSDEGLSNNSCNDIFTDDSGIAWIATDNGLNSISLSAEGRYTIKNITRSDGLLSNSIMFAEGDHTGSLWIGHENGLSRLDIQSGKIMTYGESDGFTALETYQKAVSVDRNNHVWIGTVNGLFRYNPERDVPQKNPPRTYITAVEFYNDTSDIYAYTSLADSLSGLPTDLVLTYHKNNLVFTFVGLHYANTAKNTYQYKLEGYDDKWSEITVNTSSHPYQKLPHGNYKFIVKAANCDGVWSAPVVFSFIIRPPFWKTVWFYFIEIAAGISLILAFVRIRERKLKHDRKVLTQKVSERTAEIERQRDHIAEINRSITDSIMYAQRIQSAVLPEEDLIRKVLGEFFILFKPRDIVSGDFYWISSKGSKIIFVVADCTGHGVPGAFMSMLGVSLLNEIVTSSDSFTAADILNQLRNNLKRTLSQTGKANEARDGIDLTLFMINPERKEAQFAGAYNPLLLVSGNEMTVFKGDKMPIGIHLAQEKPFTNHVFPVASGDMIYMYSDGYADQFGGPLQKKFNSIRFRELLQQIHREPLDVQKNILNSNFENWKGDKPQIDDILVTGIKITL